MEEERLMILKMVEEGKITSEEAAGLLAALEEHARTERELEEADVKKEVKRTVESFGETIERKSRDIERTATDFAERLEEQISEKVENVPSMIERLLEGLNLSGFMGLFGATHEFREELAGSFEAPEGTVIELDFRTKNGRIEVQGWNEPDYKLVLNKKVAASSEDEAKQMAAQMVEFEQSGQRLMLRLKNGDLLSRSSLSVKAYVPLRYTYRPLLESSNGRVAVDGIDLEEAELRTSNGRIECTGVRAENIKAHTSNGRVVLDGISGNVVARTSNGRIALNTVAMAEDATFDLQTSNGSIRIRTEERDELGYHLKVGTSLGKLDLALGNLVYDEDNRERRGHKSAMAHTENFENRPIKVRITAKTSNGSVRIGTADTD